MKVCLLVLLGVFCFCNTIISPINPIDGTGGFGLVWFIVLYFTSAYIKKFYKSDDKSLKYFLLYASLTLIGFGGYYFCRFIGLDFISDLLLKYNSVNVFLQSLFLVFGISKFRN